MINEGSCYHLSFVQPVWFCGRSLQASRDKKFWNITPARICTISAHIAFVTQLRKCCFDSVHRIMVKRFGDNDVTQKCRNTVQTKKSRGREGRTKFGSCGLSIRFVVTEFAVPNENMLHLRDTRNLWATNLIHVIYTARTLRENRIALRTKWRNWNLSRSSRTISECSIYWAIVNYMTARN